MSELALELRIEAIRRRMNRKDFLLVVAESAKAYVGRSCDMTGLNEEEFSDLLAFHRMLEEAFEIRGRATAIADQIELEEANLRACQPEAMRFVSAKLQSLRDQQIDCTVKSGFLTQQNYHLAEFFENYIPKVVLVRRKLNAA